MDPEPANQTKMHNGLGSQSTAVVVMAPAKLLAENPALRAKVINHLQVALVHPLGDGDEPAPFQSDRVFGPYEVSPSLCEVPGRIAESWRIAATLAGQTPAGVS
jgi:hypothetical protein